ncbi:MAG: hypothetical protein LBC45_04745 [Chlamydiales bacterium]|nr:hypothetical protein [Chlamydiales bacterium]
MPIGYNGSQNTVLLPCDSQISWKMPPSFLQADLTLCRRMQLTFSTRLVFPDFFLLQNALLEE